MNNVAPLSVILKFAFIAVLYLFVIWVARSAARDLRGSRRPDAPGAPPPPDATGLHAASALGQVRGGERAPRLVVERAPGHDPGMIYDLVGEVVLGRGEDADILLEDPFASSRHAVIYEQGEVSVIEDLASTNGTYMNEELLQSPRPLHTGDRVRIGDSEFEFRAD
ncbi:MAG TPA: FHA domain-containing protein [Solirubrobacteraceae bacterium]|nr:FHA domain-containing protein [Solirubrobacteraceae bacterium]